MLQTKGINKLRKSFALIIVACLTIIFFIAFEDFRAKARDTKRQADLSQIVKALDTYYDRHGSYPEVTDDDWQGWDMTVKPDGSRSDFLPILREEKIILSQFRDPLNNTDYFYRYKKFEFGSYDCLNTYYILQLINFETYQEDHGRGNCPKYNFTEEIPNGYTIMRYE